jgi:AcrR family transcriptional regulator
METAASASRRRNPRGQGDALRAEMIEAAATLLDELADDEALSLRAVARAVHIAATSVYIHFADRDALVLAVMHRCQQELLSLGAAAEAAAPDPTTQLRAQLQAHITWALAHPGLYKVLHESAVNRRDRQASKQALLDQTTAAIRRCIETGAIETGAAPPDDNPTTIAIDLRTAVNGMLSARINAPDDPWPPAEAQLDRYLTKLVGLPLRFVAQGDRA